MPLNRLGELSIRAFTAGGALPVENAIIRIRGAMEENRDVELSLLTDLDGLTNKVQLPTSEIKYSQSPTPQEAPFANYDVEIIKEGYYSKKIYNLPIFDSIDTTLPVSMIPIPTNQPANDFPRDNLSTVIFESLEEI